MVFEDGDHDLTTFVHVTPKYTSALNCQSIFLASDHNLTVCEKDGGFHNHN